MKITIITSPFGYIPPKGIGAVEKLWYDIGLEFVKQGHNVCFISKTNGNIKESDTLVEHGVSYLFVKGYRRGLLFLDLILDFIYSLKALLKMKSCDILVMNTFWTPALCGLFRKKYKVSVYNVERMPKGQFGLYPAVDRLSCVSQAVKKVLIEQAPNLVDKIKVISNPVNTEVYSYTERDKADGMIVVMYHGRIHPEKGLDILVKAYNSLLAEYDNLALVLVGTVSKEMGGGGNEYRRYLESLTHRKIKFVDPISDARLLSETVASCDIYCYPSVAEKGETFGVAPLEAMALGRPVIVSDLDCFKDFVEDGINGFIFDHREKGAVERLSYLMKQLIENEELCKDIGCHAAKTAKRFSVANIADSYLQDFNQMMLDKKYK
ncbi:glycosyltransferase family 4 protein [Parabacteroides sp. AF17-28]|uniref:glycosyltransferase family 4 protein n=1 Tax=Parabacteroides sp. AF17-28 TaxID=2292241 RepID=UPI000EFE0464|nr:glycosyltransferase family 4 protein [Parabacteroides sp. AF17-28]RHR52624.1 glycosyltransferase family 1 protein [Parabacteroides sp. AF17-28]